MQRLCTRFHGYRRLQLYSTSTATSPSTDSFTNYLVDSLGLSPQQALVTSKRLSCYRKVDDFNFDANAVSVVGFLRSYGFDDTHLKRIVSSFPKLLCSNVDNTVRPKIQLLQDHGFLESDIIHFVYANPKLLQSGVESSFMPGFQILREIMGSDTRVIAILKKSWFDTSMTKHLVPNVAMLTSYGIPIELIRKHLIGHPTAFMRKPEIFNDMVSRVINKWGICPNSPMFLYGIQLACGYSEENIESKCQMFKSFGWTQSDIQTLTMKSPPCFHHSEAAIKKKLNFLMNELRLEPGYLTSNNDFLSLSLEKRIMPRHKILLFLKEKGLLENNPSLNTGICMPESRFLNMFVLPFKEIHEVYAELTGCSMKMRKIAEDFDYAVSIGVEKGLALFIHNAIVSVDCRVTYQLCYDWRCFL